MGVSMLLNLALVIVNNNWIIDDCFVILFCFFWVIFGELWCLNCWENSNLFFLFIYSYITKRFWFIKVLKFMVKMILNPRIIFRAVLSFLFENFRCFTNKFTLLIKSKRKGQLQLRSNLASLVTNNWIIGDCFVMLFVLCIFFCGV